MLDNMEFSTALFMEEVQMYECLYNKFNKQYKNKFVRLNCWRKIAEKLSMKLAEAEKKVKERLDGLWSIFEEEEQVTIWMRKTRSASATRWICVFLMAWNTHKS